MEAPRISDLSPEQVVFDAVSSLEPHDELEREHKQDVLDWIARGEPLFRVSKPDNPTKHLVSYFVLIDEANSSLMLIDHVKANLWLPTGGHVDVGENPRDTVVREAEEELQLQAEFTTPFGEQPFFLTVTTTRGFGEHTDVSLWYLIKGNPAVELTFDTSEINRCSWLTFDQILATDITELDPHMHRFIAKIKQRLIAIPA